MKKAQFVKNLANRMDVPLDKARDFVSTFEDLIMEVIALEDKVTFVFGTMGGKTKRATQYRHPHTGEMIPVPEKDWQPYYTPSKKAKEY